MELVAITKDWFPEVARIYSEGLNTGIATFETQVPDWEHWNASRHIFGRIAFIENEKMLGWASLSPVSGRAVYSGVAETSIYISEHSRGKGIGEKLLRALILESEKNNVWTLQAGIFRENEPSIALHSKCGFRKIGYREKVASRNGIWYDNIIMERRSKIIGII